jgi:hypothetical protein
MRLQPVHLLLPALALSLAGLAGCGPGGSGGSDATAGDDAQADEVGESHGDVRLAVEGLTADPKGPTTASTVTVSFAIVNHGADATPYRSSGGNFSYLPIAWTVVRDGQPVASGTIKGLTGDDSQPCRAVLHDEPVGDRTYHVVLDGAGTGAKAPILSDTITVPFGGSG